MEIKRDMTKPLLETVNGGAEDIKQLVAQHVERQAVDELIYALLSSETGRVFIGMLLAETRYFENSFIGSAMSSADGKVDMSKVAFFQGRASVGEYVHGMVYNFNQSEPYVHMCIQEYNDWVGRKAKERDSLTSAKLKAREGAELRGGKIDG